MQHHIHTEHHVRRIHPNGSLQGESETLINSHAAPDETDLTPTDSNKMLEMFKVDESLCEWTGMEENR